MLQKITFRSVVFLGAGHGLLKMIAIGLGKHAGALRLHSRGFENMEDSIKRATEIAIGADKILFGIAIVENELHQTCWLKCVCPENFFNIDKYAQALSKTVIGGIPFKDIDVLFIQEIGKEISGNGFDPNIADRFQFKGKVLHTGANPRYVIVSNLTKITHGNAAGIGSADLIIERLYEKLDLEKTYINCITARKPDEARIPMIVKNDESAMKLCMMMCDKDKHNIRVVCMQNTMTSMQLYISPALIGECDCDTNVDLKMMDGYYVDL
jgi:hypothetical protein